MAKVTDWGIPLVVRFQKGNWMGNVTMLCIPARYVGRQAESSCRDRACVGKSLAIVTSTSTRVLFWPNLANYLCLIGVGLFVSLAKVSYFQSIHYRFVSFSLEH